MLVPSRKNREAVVVGGGGRFQGLLKVTVLEIAIGKVKLGLKSITTYPCIALSRRISRANEFRSVEKEGPKSCQLLPAYGSTITKPSWS